MVPSSTHMASATGEVFPITSVITCKTKNIIYNLWCDKCRGSPGAIPGCDQYTGKSSNDGATRFSGHKSDINTRKNKAVAEHFNQPGHSSSDARFLPFEVVHGDETLLNSREQYWINKKKLLNLESIAKNNYGVSSYCCQKHLTFSSSLFN